MLHFHQDATSPMTSSSRSNTPDLARVAPWTTSTAALEPKAQGTTRKKLVPKKSKLGIFGSQRLTTSHTRSQSHAVLSSSKENAAPPTASLSKSTSKSTLKTSSFSRSTVRGTSSTLRGSTRLTTLADELSFADTSTVDPDVGEIVVVKRKKSRVGLEGIGWQDAPTAAFGDVSTNVPRTTSPVEHSRSSTPLEEAPKKEDKWWSTIGRARKESKDWKASLRAKTPEPGLEHVRFHSLDSGNVLKTGSTRSSTTPYEEPKRAMRGRVSSAKLLNIIPTVRTPSGSEGEPRIVPMPAEDEEEVPETPAENPTGSIALRAMRSVRSLARITSWNQLKDALDDDKEKDKTTNHERKKSGTWSREDTAKKDGTLSKKDGTWSKKDTKEKEKKGKDKAATLRIRPSMSSFEAGAMTPEPESAPGHSLKRKASKILSLGLGFPTSIRSRSGSTASSVLLSPTVSANPPVLPMPIIGRDRSASGASSLRPASTMTTSSGGSRLSSSSDMAASTMSRLSSSSSGVSVKWDEECLQTVKERRRKERREKAEQDAKEGKPPSKRSAGKGSKNKRTALFDLFPSETAAVSTAGLLEGERLQRPLLSLDLDDGRSVYSYSSTGTETPTRRRSRPVSESSHQSGEVISILDAATNDLAHLIDVLDLEATPASPDKTPSRSIRPRSLELTPSKKDDQDSPLRKKGKLRPKQSIRGPMLGKQIAPWPELDVPAPPSGKPATLTPKTARTIKVRASKREPTPSPAPEAPPVFQPLPPASRRAPDVYEERESIRTERSHRVPSMITFGKRTSVSDMDDADISDEMTFRRPSSRQSSGFGLPKVAREMKRRMGLGGTLGGSAASGYIREELDPSDPDSDIPDELQLILTRGAERDPDDTFDFRCRASSPLGDPPHIPLPSPLPNELDLDDLPAELPSLILTRANSAQQPEEESFTSTHSDDEDFTKKSFDFTGEIRRLTTTDSDRASFVEQLERAFKTPAKIDLRYGLDFSFSGAPNLCSESVREEDEEEIEEPESFDVEACTPIVHPLSESFVPSATSSFHKGSSVEEDEDEEEEEEDVEPSFVSNMISTGELKKDFKFGGPPSATRRLPTPPQIVEPTESELEEEEEEDLTGTLSHVSTEDSCNSSVLRSIMAEARPDLPNDFLAPPRPRPRSMKPVFRADVARRSVYGDDTGSNRSSMISFMGMGESFDEVRRGFEFHDYRPGFYPPAPGAPTNRTFNFAPNFNTKRESVMSFASVSSFGRVLNAGKPDPFDYGVHANNAKGLSNIRERPSVEAMSTKAREDFSFQPRQRVDSDASSFYFKPTARDRRRESAMSTNSLARNSLYNRTFGNPCFNHKKNGSTSSFGSLAHNYASYNNTAGNRDSWAFHRRNGSVESVASDFSAMRLGRPDIGDKMFDQSSPRALDTITTEGSDEYTDHRLSTFDSLMDDTRGQKMSFRDSMFDTANHRMSMMSCTESLFGARDARHNHLRPQTVRYRPLSVASINSEHDPLADGDTMISMLGGGRVRRISVSSAVEASPCARVGKRKHAHTYSDVDPDLEGSPRKARIIEKPPTMLTSLSTFKTSEERVFKPAEPAPSRKSLEDDGVSTSGDESSWSLHKVPVFSRPGTQTRPRSNTTTTTTTTGQDTPPLEASDGSQSDGSQSSIDVKSLDSMLSSSAYSTGRARARARGRGHKRFSQLQMARASVYETIDEESSAYESPARLMTLSPPSQHSVYIADPETVSFHGSIGEESIWDNESGLEVLRKFYALRDEAQDIVQESKRTWADTAFSNFALQTFRVPCNPTGMQALLEHSQKNFGPLPSELRPHRVRSRTSSRVNPYTVPTPARSIKRSLSPGARRPLSGTSATFALHDVQNNMPNPDLDTERSFGDADDADSLSWTAPRAHNTSASKRNGWAKRNASKTSLVSKSSRASIKENAPISTGSGENSGVGTILSQGLRISRPRPKGRSAASARPRALNVFN